MNNIKNYVLGTLLVGVLFLGSVVYKQQNAMVCHHFPVPESLLKKSEKGTFYLFLFFSKNDCIPCLVEIIEVLNKLSPQFCPAGVVPGEELKNEKELRRLTGVTFPLYSFQKFKKYLPGHTPTIFGVSSSGKIIAVIPYIKGQDAYLGNTLRVIYENIPMEDGNEKKRR